MRGNRQGVIARLARQAALSLGGYRSFLEDLRSAIERSQLGDIARQLLVGSDHQIALRSEPFQHARQDLTLEWHGEIGKGDISAEDEVEEARRRLRPEILIKKFDPLAMLRLDAVAEVQPVKALFDQRRRQFVQACRLKTACTGAREHRLVDIRGDDRERDGWICGRNLEIPEYF